MDAYDLRALIRRHGWRRLVGEAARAAPLLLDAQGRAQLRDRLRRVDAELDDDTSYATWIRFYENEAYYAPYRQDGERPTEPRLQRAPAPTLFSILMPVYDPPEPFLREALDSVLAQTYAHWELCISDDASTAPHVARVLGEYAERDARIKAQRRATNGHICAASNSALELATGDFLVLLDHDDRLHPHALQCLAATVARHADANLVYSDEDRLLVDGTRATPYFKPDFDPDLLCAQNLVSHLGCYRTRLVRELGGFRAGFEGSQDWDLALRVVERSRPEQIVHVPRVLYHWRVSAHSTASTHSAKPYAREAARRAVAEHLQRTGIPARVLDCPELPSANRVRFELPAPAPACTLVIPTRDNAAMLERCIDSLRRRTEYPALAFVIVDNGSRAPAALQLLERLRQEGVTVLRHDIEFNFSRLNNLAVATLDTPFVCLLNDDVEAVDGDWLREMIATAARPEIGVVGARLWYPDLRLQHAGIVLNMAGAAGHAHKGLRQGDAGYFGRAVLQQQFSAVTAACMLVRRAAFVAVNGFDEGFPVAYGDVDFCLRIRDAGYRVVWAPGAELLHHESATRGADVHGARRDRLLAEQRSLRARWDDRLRLDPAYSPNLALDREDFSLAWPPRLEP